jgi:hypothetical protein
LKRAHFVLVQQLLVEHEQSIADRRVRHLEPRQCDVDRVAALRIDQLDRRSLGGGGGGGTRGTDGGTTT